MHVILGYKSDIRRNADYLHCHSVNLRDVIENCRDILEAKAGEQEITLDTTGMAEFNPPQLLASEVHLRQIFMNIISNAIKYNKYGGKIFIQAIVLE